VQTSWFAPDSQEKAHTLLSMLNLACGLMGWRGPTENISSTLSWESDDWFEGKCPSKGKGALIGLEAISLQKADDQATNDGILPIGRFL